MYRHSIIVIFIGLCELVQAQLTVPGQPISFKSASTTDTIYDMPSVDNNKLLTQHSAVIDNKKPMVFAHTFEVDFSPANQGSWFDYNNLSVWRITMRSKNARSLNIQFSEYQVASRVRIFVYPTYGTSYLGAFSNLNNKPYEQLAIAPIEGDAITVEMQVPADCSDYGKLRIGAVSHDFRGILPYKDGQFQVSDNCNIDVACDANALVSKVKNSVCRIIFNGNQLCSGALINTTRNDGTPYLLTANHCLGSSSAAKSAIFLFGYQSQFCDTITDWANHLSLSGATIKATTSALDFSLVELSEAPNATMNPYYAGWNISETDVSSTFSIHHPQGDLKKISYDNDAPGLASFPGDYESDTHWQVNQWDAGVTEPGSSGGPLFDQHARIIGDLTGGDASCSYLYDDYYARLSKSWNKYSASNNQLKYWLDPDNSGISAIDGYDPFSGLKSTCTSGVGSFDNTFVASYPGGGYWSGHNSFGYSQFTQGYVTSGQGELLGARIRVANANFQAYGSRITLRVWNGIEAPEIVLAEQDFRIKYFADNHDYDMYFNRVVNVPDRFFVGYKIYYTYSEDTFVVAQQEGVVSEGYFLYDGASWKKSSTLTGNTHSLAIQPFICGAILDTNEHIISSGLKIAQNKATKELIVYKPFQLKTRYTLSLHDIAGRTVWQSEHSALQETVTIEGNRLRSGVYICYIRDKSVQYSSKVLIY